MALSPSSSPRAPLVLIVEDDPLIAFDLKQMLVEQGFCVLGPAFSVESALALLEDAAPDAAVLDFDIRGSKVTPVAEVLADHHVPFVLASGNSGGFEDEILARVRNFGKPVNPPALLDALQKLTHAVEG